MALDNAALTWNANTEPDFALYKLYWGPVLPLTILTAQTITTVNAFATLTVVSFDMDGLHYFALSALDTAGNESAQSSTVSKRIIRVAGKFRLKR